MRAEFLNVYAKLMDEDAATAAKREMLKMEQGKFIQALQSIESLESEMTSDVASIVESSGLRSDPAERRDSNVTMEVEMRYATGEM